MRLKNRETIYTNAQQLNPELGTIAKNDVDITPEDILRETALCLALSNALAQYAQYLNNPGNYTQPDSKDPTNESV